MNYLYSPDEAPTVGELIFRRPVDGRFTSRQEAERERLRRDAESAAAELTRALAEARQQACEARDELWQARLDDSLATERTALQLACAGLTMARARFFREAETQVVAMALAYAGKVLARAVENDGAALAPAVLAALGELPGEDGVRLLVAGEDEAAWQRWAASVPHVVVTIDAALEAGECRLQTPAGFAELGVRAQMATLSTDAQGWLARRSA